MNNVLSRDFREQKSPTVDIEELLVSSINYMDEAIFLEKGVNVNSLSDDIYFISKGIVEVRNTQSLHVICYLQNHFPIGVIDYDNLSYITRTNCKLHIVKKEKWNLLVRENHLEKHITSIAIHFISLLVIFLSEIQLESTYRKIRRLIYYYNDSKTLLKDIKEPLISYITSRTVISRSHTLKILAELRKGEYITMKKGYLISININLPEEF